MEILKNFILIVVAIVFILVLIGISSKILNFINEQNEFFLKGDKQRIVKKIVDLIYKCYEKNKYKKESVICFRVNITSDEIIYSYDIIEKISSSRIDTEKLIIPDILQNNSIVIRYENKFVYIEAIEGEIVGS